MRTLALLLALALLSPGCAVAAGEEAAPYKAEVGADGVQRVEVRAGSYYFEPAHIVVKVGVPVELIVSKEPGLFHDMAMDAPEAGMDFRRELDKDRPVVIRFTPGKTGKYEFYCGKRFLFFKSHRARGMEGVLEVVE
ncbi:MAG: hypothetical protein Kow0025_16600 [Thermodesulfovibrionales bacterium]